MSKVCLEEAQACESATRVPAEMTDARAHVRRSHMGQRGGAIEGEINVPADVHTYAYILQISSIYMCMF